MSQCQRCGGIKGLHHSILPGCNCYLLEPPSEENWRPVMPLIGRPPLQDWQKTFVKPELAQRKQLSDRMIWQLFERSGLSAYHVNDAQMLTQYDECLVRFVRAIEGAHGIGQDE
jgi:hypothetical protein